MPVETSEHKPIAPEMLRPAWAATAGEYLRQIASCSELLAQFEAPTYRRGGLSRGYFRRSIEQVLSSEESDRAFDALLNAGLLLREPGGHFYSPTCRINRLEIPWIAQSEPVFICTDSPVAQHTTRIFPWSDEGDLLFREAVRGSLKNSPKRILDVCSGAGTCGLLLARNFRDAEVIGIDVNDRALLYGNFNSELNRARNCRFVLFDLEKRESLAEKLGGGNFDLICADPPFTPVPRQIVGYRHSSDTNILKSALEHTLPLLAVGGKLELLGYFFGSTERPTELYELFDVLDMQSLAKPTWSKANSRVWRLYGRKRIHLNPMPVQYMASRYFDPDWQGMFKAANFEFEDYVDWIEEFVSHSLTHLHYLCVRFERVR